MSGPRVTCPECGGRGVVEVPAGPVRGGRVRLTARRCWVCVGEGRL